MVAPARQQRAVVLSTAGVFVASVWASGVNFSMLWTVAKSQMKDDRFTENCTLVRKETLCEGRSRGEPVRRFVFQPPPNASMTVQTGLRQVVVVNAVGVRRLYSPTSKPRQDGTFDLVIRVYRQGRVSRWLDSLRLGDSVSMTWPYPTPLPSNRRNPGRHVGLIAFGIGITELYRTAVQELADPRVREVVLLYATRTMEEQQVLKSELRELACQEPKRFRLVAILSEEQVPGVLFGRLNSSVLAEVFPWQADGLRRGARFIPAGTKAMIQAAHTWLEELGYRPDRYKLIRDATMLRRHNLTK
ncbi:CBR1 [Symbiodinium sp. CCMP2592]|nr:CBR1 [Symbiodinium sp. CCMP2592]